MVGGKIRDRGARDLDDVAARQRGDGVIHLAQERDVQVAQVARNKERHDLTAAVGEELVAIGEPIHHDAGSLAATAFADEILAGFNHVRGE